MAFKDFRPGLPVPIAPGAGTTQEPAKRRSFRDFAPAPTSPESAPLELPVAEPDSGWTVTETPPFVPDLSSRPWWQKTIDAIVPGEQFRSAQTPAAVPSAASPEPVAPVSPAPSITTDAFDPNPFAAPDFASLVPTTAAKVPRDRLATYQANPSYFASAILEGRVLPAEVAAMPPEALPFGELQRISSNPATIYGPFKPLADLGLQNPQAGRTALLDFLQNRETTGYDVTRAIKTAAAELVTLGAQRPEVQPQTAAGQVADVATRIAGTVATLPVAAGTGGAGLAGAARALGATGAALRAARGVGTGLALAGSRTAGKALTGEFDAEDAAEMGKEAAFFGLLDAIMPGVGGTVGRAVFERLPTAVRNTALGRALVGGVGSFAAGGTASGGIEAASAVLGDGDADAQEVLLRVLTDAATVGLFGAVGAALRTRPGAAEAGFTTPPKAEIIGEQINGRIFRGLVGEELVQARRLNGNLSQLGYQEWRSGSGVWQKRRPDGQLIGEVHEDVIVAGRQVPKVVAERAPRAMQQPAEPVRSEPAQTPTDARIAIEPVTSRPGPPIAATQTVVSNPPPQATEPAVISAAQESAPVTAAQPTLSLDRAAYIRNLNPALDERAIQQTVQTTAQASDEEFQAMAQRQFGPQLSPTVSTPPVVQPVETPAPVTPVTPQDAGNAIDRNALYRELYPEGSDKARENVVGNVWPKYAEDKALLDQLFKNATPQQRSVILQYQQQMKATPAKATDISEAPSQSVKDRPLPKTEPTGELGFPASTAATAGRVAAPAKEASATRAVTEPTKQNIVNFISRTFQVPVRQGRFRQSAEGIYKWKPEVIRTKGQNLVVHAHELGHHLDKTLGLSKDGRFDADLLPLGQALYPNETNPDTLRKEGIAEFMRMFIAHPQSAYDAAPEYTRELKRVLDENPDVGQGVEELRKLYDAYSNLDPQQHIRAGIAPHKPSILKRLRETLNPARLASTAYASAVDEYSPILAAENAILAGAKMPQTGRLADVPLSVLRSGARLRKNVSPTDSAFSTLWRARGIEGRADRWILGDGRDAEPGGPVVGKTLQQVLTPVKGQMDDFRDYVVALKASRAQELGLETGFDADKVQAVLKKLGSPVFKKTADELAAFRRATTQELVKAGILDADTVKGWEERWPYPFPFYRDMGEGQSSQGGGKKAVNIGKPVKTMKGSERAIIDPIQSIIRDTYHYFKLAEMNKAAQNLVKAAEDADGMGWLVEKVPNPMEGRQFKLEEIQRFLDPAVLESEAFDPTAVAAIFRPQRVAGVKEAQENIATVWMDGKPVFYQFNPDIYDALFKVGPQFGKSTEWIVKALRPFARVLRSSVTLGIEFAGRNVLRDSAETWVYSKAGVTPWDTMTAGFELLTRQLTGKGMPKDFWQAKGAGAFFKAAIVSMDRDYQAMSIDQLLGDRPGRLQRAVNFFGQPTKMPARMFHALESFSEFFENINRYAEVRKMGRKSGWDKQSALEIALAGRDVTIDFGRSGNRADFVKAITAFWNAQVQGLDKFVRVHKENPGRTVLRALLYVTIPTLLHYLWVKDDPDYEEQPRWMKDAFYLIPAGKNADGHTRFVPFPRVFAPLGLLYGVLPLRMMEYLETHDKRAADELTTRLRELAPLQLPTLIGVINGVWNNKGWWGGPIVPQEEERYEAAEQYGAGTSEFAKQIGKVANVSPRKVDYVITGLSGYLGKYTIYGLDKLAIAAGVRPNPPEGDVEDLPVLRAFLKSGVGTSSESLNRFYEEKDALDREYNTMRKNADEGFYDKLPQEEKTTIVVRATEMQAKRTAMNAVARSLSDLRRLRTDLDEGLKREVQNFTPAQRKKIIDAIDTLRANIARAYYQKADMLPTDKELQNRLLEYIK